MALAVDATALLTENVAFVPASTFWLIGPEILKVTAGAIVIESGAAVLFPALFLAIKLSKKLKIQVLICIHLIQMEFYYISPLKNCNKFISLAH